MSVRASSLDLLGRRLYLEFSRKRGWIRRLWLVLGLRDRVIKVHEVLFLVVGHADDVFGLLVASRILLLRIYNVSWVVNNLRGLGGLVSRE